MALNEKTQDVVFQKQKNTTYCYHFGMKMKCPYCLAEETKVVDKRDTEMSTKRRRECLKCGKRFTTFERVEDAGIVVVKRSGAKEKYSRDKIKIGISKACEKRGVSGEQVEDALDKIEKELRNLDTTEIPSSKIGDTVMKYLKKLDKVAYIRFASVYKEFADVEEFQEELKKLLKK